MQLLPYGLARPDRPPAFPSPADKIGVTDAEKEYNERLLPVIQAHPELFPADRFERCFSLERFHIQGSRILSRSFHVESGEGASGLARAVSQIDR